MEMMAITPSTVLPMLLDASVKGSVLILLLLGAARLVRGTASAATRYLMWSAGLFGLVCIPLMSAVLPWRVPVLALPTTVSHVAGASGVGAVAISGDAGEGVLPERDREAVRRTAEPRAGAGPAGALVLAWLVGAVLVLGRIAIGWMLVCRMASRGHALDAPEWKWHLSEAIRQLGVTTSVRLVRSPAAHGPFITGPWRAAIVLPDQCRQWSPERRRAVMLHELAHVQRRDVAVQFLAWFVTAVHWFNPLVWIMARRLRAESERACDDMVLRAGVRASAYASDLMDLVHSSRHGPRPAMAVGFARESEFEGRMLAILEAGAARHPTSRLTSACVIGAVFFMVVSLTIAGPPPVSASTGSTNQELTLPTDDTVAVKALLSVLADDLDPRVRAGAAWALGEIADPISVDGLASATADAEDGVRLAAVWALQELQDLRTLPALLNALTDESAEVRAMAARGIGGLDLREPPAELAAAVSDPNPEVRSMAVWALGEIR
jgi:beta-lactamase regulating signal transducer with metallopeptidase domain